MIQICKNSSTKDVGKVIPGLFPDIDNLLENHKIGDTSAQVVYNQLSEIAKVGFRINDDFDAIVLSRALNSFLKSGLQPNQGHGSSQQAGSSAPVVSSDVSSPSE